MTDGPIPEAVMKRLKREADMAAAFPRMLQAIEATKGLLNQMHDHGSLMSYYGGYRAAKLVDEALDLAKKVEQ